MNNFTQYVFTISKNSFKKFFAVCSFLLVSVLSFGQTNPTAQSLPYTQDFNSLTGTAPVYPAGFQGWNIAGSLSASYPIATPNGNRAITTVTNTTAAIHVGDFIGKMGLYSSNSALSSVCLSIVTTNLTNIQVSFDAMTQRNENSRINELGLQYRVGTTGNFTNVSTGTYQNTLLPTNTTGTTSVNVLPKTATLPVGAEGQAVVQLRWVIRQVSGSGNNVGFAIDNVSVTGASSGKISVASGNWSDPSIWSPTGVPTSTENATIVSGHVVNMDNLTYSTRASGTSTIVNSGGTLSTSVQYVNNGTTTINGTFQLNAGGYTNSGNNFVYGASNSFLVFNNTSSYGVNDADQYWPTTNSPFNVIIIQGGMTLNSGVNRTVAGTFQTTAAITLNGVLTLNGNARINTGGSFLNAPIYGNASNLIYNTATTYARGVEWSATTGTIGVTPGLPNNVTVTGNTTLNYANGSSSTFIANGSLEIFPGSSLYQNFSGGNAGLTVGSNVIVNGNITLGTLSGDLALGGNLTVGAAANFSTNGRAVTFNAATGSQTITKTGTGVVFFDYLIKSSSGNLVLSSSPATSVAINGSAGDVLQLLSSGNLDINGQTLTLNNNGGNIFVNASRNITSTIAGATLAITGNKFVTGAGTLFLAPNVTTVLTAGLDFGSNKTTVNGILQINNGGFVSTNAPIYSVSSTLVYNGVSSYGVGSEWTGNATSSGLGTPRNVTLTSSSVVMPNSVRSLAGSLNIGSGSNLTLNSAFGSDLNIGGNWNNSGTFTPNNRLVQFRGVSGQTINGATTFDFLTQNNTTLITLSASSAVTVNQILALTSGKITLNANDLNVNGSITGQDNNDYIVTNSTGQLRQTVGTSPIIFPVGNTVYNPITFTNSGTSDIYGVRVVNTAPVCINPTKTVTRQWITTEAVAGGSNLAVVAQYSTGQTGTGFATATNNFIGFYNETSWIQSPATQSGSNPFITSSNSNLSPTDLTTGSQYFAIGRDNAFVSVATQFGIVALSPSTPGVGYPFSVTVQSQDAFGLGTNVIADTSFTISTNGNAGAIGGTITGTILAGTNSIVVSGVTLANAGTGVTVTATQTSGDSLTLGTSSTFTVLEAATQLAFVGVPATGNVSTSLTSFTVEARRTDNTVDTLYNSNIVLTKASGSGNLLGTSVSVTPVNGVATFTTAQFDAASTYTLNANSGSLSQITSSNIVVTLAPVTLYLHNFNTGATASPYAVLPTATTGTPTGVLNSLFTNVTSWISSTGSFFNFVGNSGQALVIQPGNGVVSSMTLTLNVLDGYQANLSSFNFWRQKSTTGPNISSITINGNQILGSSVSPTAGTFLGNTTISNANNLTGTLTVVINLTAPTGASQNLRLDEFTLSGNIICIEPIAYSVTGGGNGCASPGVPVGLSNSQIGVNYQLKNGATNVGSLVAGTGSAISFGNQSVAGTYTVEASNINGTCNLTLAMSGNAVVSIISPATITTQPQPQTVCEGSSATFTVALSGSTSYLYEWKKNGTAISGAPDLATYTIATTTLADAGSYSVDVLDDCLNIISSSTATLTINAQTVPTFTQVAPICFGVTLSALPTTSDNGILGTWLPALDNTQTTVYTFTPNVGECATTALMTIEVNPIPTLNTVSATPACINSPSSVTMTGLLPSTVGSFTYTNSMTGPFVYNVSGVSDASGNFTFDTPNLPAVANGAIITITSGTATATGCTTNFTGKTVTVVVGKVTTWTGTIWDQGTPTSIDTAVIPLAYSEVANINACSLVVNTNAVVTIPSGSNVILNGALTVDTGSSFTLNNNANLVQTTNVANSGNITVRRTTNPLMRFDYVLWSSPVDGTQSLLNFSPLTSVSPTIRFYTYDSSSNQYASVASTSSEFLNATGYLIRLPFNHPTAPAAWTGSFVGQPNNGPISLSTTSGLYYATGNPYPSTIDADEFITENGLNDALYFWRKTNGALGSAYATYTLAGGTTPTPGTSASPTSAVPNGTIQVGQGFLAKATSTSLVFNNQMRIADNNNQTFRTSSSALSTIAIERNRVWLNLSNTTATIGQTMVSYMTGATNGIDAQIDGNYINDSQTALTSIISGQEFAVQGKTLPFDVTDIVPLGFKSETSGNFSISLFDKDGLFANTTQEIYLRDNQTGTVHNLNSGAYSFTSTNGTFNSRFEVIYQNALNIDTPTLTSSNVIVYNNNNVLTINTGIFDMATVKVFDIRGRLLTEKLNINATQTTLNISETNQILLVQITSNEGITITKKVVN